MHARASSIDRPDLIALLSSNGSTVREWAAMALASLEIEGAAEPPTVPAWNGRHRRTGASPPDIRWALTELGARSPVAPPLTRTTSSSPPPESTVPTCPRRGGRCRSGTRGDQLRLRNRALRLREGRDPAHGPVTLEHVVPIMVNPGHSEERAGNSEERKRQRATPPNPDSPDKGRARLSLGREAKRRRYSRCSPSSFASTGDRLMTAPVRSNGSRGHCSKGG